MLEMDRDGGSGQQQKTHHAKVRRISRRTYRANVIHHCTCCRHPIRPGQRYVAVACVVDGQFSFWKYHKGKWDCVWD